MPATTPFTTEFRKMRGVQSSTECLVRDGERVVASAFRVRATKRSKWELRMSLTDRFYGDLPASIVSRVTEIARFVESIEWPEGDA